MISKVLTASFLSLFIVSCSGGSDGAPANGGDNLPPPQGKPQLIQLQTTDLILVTAPNGYGKNKVHSSDNIEGAKTLVKIFPFNTGNFSRFILHGPQKNYSVCKSTGKITFNVISDDGSQAPMTASAYLDLPPQTDFYLEAKADNIDCLSLGFSFDVEALQ